MPTHFNPSRSLVPGFAPLFAVAVSLLALAVAYGSQYLGGLHPCELCYWQRLPYAAILLAGLIAFWVRKATPAFSKALTWLCLIGLFSAAGLAVLHTGVEYAWWEGPGACTAAIETGANLEEILAQIKSAPAVSCKTPAVKIGGLSMAGWNALYAFASSVILWTLVRRT